ncbi:MAG: hypothetical protein LC799_27725 [Actinobacteria bacterium]|nr:hypothetical protein [Actinomycetota bacterium]
MTVEPELIAAAHQAVAEGRAESVSGWVNAALTDLAARDRRRRALGEVVAAYEAEFGVISDGELAARERADRESAVVVRGAGTPRSA